MVADRKPAIGLFLATSGGPGHSLAAAFGTGIAQTVVDVVGSSMLTMEQLSEIPQTEDKR